VSTIGPTGNIVTEEYKQDDLESAAGEVRELSRRMKLDTIYTIATTAAVLNNYLRAKSKMTHFPNIVVLDALILNNGSMTSKALSKIIYRGKDTVSRMIDRLEKDGLVKMETRPSLSDKRFKKVFITQKGIDFVRARMTERRRLAKEVTANLKTNDIYTLGELLRQVRKHLLDQISK